MQRILPKLIPITPKELYVQRVNATYEKIRKANRGYDYTPAQFGGVFGQQVVNNSSLVLELIDFEIK